MNNTMAILFFYVCNIFQQITTICPLFFLIHPVRFSASYENVCQDEFIHVQHGERQGHTWLTVEEFFRILQTCSIFSTYFLTITCSSYRKYWHTLYKYTSIRSHVRSITTWQTFDYTQQIEGSRRAGKWIWKSRKFHLYIVIIIITGRVTTFYPTDSDVRGEIDIQASEDQPASIVLFLTCINACVVCNANIALASLQFIGASLHRS